MTSLFEMNLSCVWEKVASLHGKQSELRFIIRFIVIATLVKKKYGATRIILK